MIEIPDPSREDFLSKIEKNIGIGLFIGCASGILLTIVVGVWNNLWRGAPVAHYGITFSTLAFLYIVGGAIAGIVAGLLSPLARWYVGALFVGVLAMTPLYFGAIAAIFGSPRYWKDSNWFAAIVSSLFVGIVLGDQWWNSSEHPGPKGSPNTEPPKPPRKFRPWK